MNSVNFTVLGCSTPYAFANATEPDFFVGNSVQMQGKCEKGYVLLLKLNQVPHINISKLSSPTRDVSRQGQLGAYIQPMGQIKELGEKVDTIMNFMTGMTAILVLVVYSC
jgi:hypothetical protein